MPVPCDPNVNVAGLMEAVGAGPGEGGGCDAVHPVRRAEADVEPSLTVTWQVDELYGEAWILNAPLPSLVPVTAPGLTVTEWFASAPDPSTRSWVPLNSARLTTTAAWALVAMGPIAPSEAVTTASTYRKRMSRPLPLEMLTTRPPHHER